jgi:hypothetical protein
MPQPLIFISHSAKEENTVQVLNALSAELGADYNVLLDRERLQPGYDWRPDLHVWLGQCNGAVIVFSPAALESPWVLKEATILTWRRALDKDFVVVPVVLSGVSSELLRQDPFAPLAITEIQAIKGGSAGEIAQRVHARLTELKDKFEVESPLQALERIVATDLRQKARPEDLHNIAGNLGLDLGPWDPHTDYCALLAQKLFAADYQIVIQAVVELLPYLRCEDAKQILEILTPFWVKPEAATNIPKVSRQPKGQRAVAINAKRADFTGHMYVRRAYCRFPSWQVCQINAIAGEDQAGSLVNEARRVLQAIYGVTSDTDLNDLMEQLEDEGEPVFIVIPPGYIDEAAFGKVRQTYPSVTFIRLLGDEQPDEEQLRLKNIVFLTPALQPDQETVAYFKYVNVRSKVSAIGAK